VTDVTQDPAANVRVELDSRPESLTLVRGMLAGVGELLGFDPELLDDLKTAVSEACNNVVLHAYGEEPGPLAVALQIDDGGVEVTVRDRGSGIQYVAPSDDRMGVGLAVISALADRAEFLRATGGGTEVRMAFLGRGGPHGMGNGEAAPELDETWASDLSGDVVVTLSPVALLPGILGRVARALAANARFSLDRFSDLYLVTDALAAHARDAAKSGWIVFAIASANHRLELTLGPFRSGTSAALGIPTGSGRQESPLALLANELSAQALESSELLRVVMLDPREPVAAESPWN
jgi:serine/threonine-protein kinase RsbW